MKHVAPFARLAWMLALACGGAMADQENLGLLNARGTQFGNTFYATSHGFTDYYTFRIGDAGSVSGTTSDGAPSGSSSSFYAVAGKDVVLTSLILGNAAFTQYHGVDLSIPSNGALNTFSFASLAAGTYKLAVTGYVTGGDARRTSASYAGVIRTTASVASPAPEPADLALTLMGLTGVGFMLRKTRRAA